MDTSYNVFEIAKKGGGKRVIEAPNDELKVWQREDLGRLYSIYKRARQAHGFEPWRSIATMARPHAGADVVLRFDLRNFFPSITFDAFVEKEWLARRNAKTRRHWRRSRPERLELNPTEREMLLNHFNDFGDGKGLRLPQGAPASPLLSNVYMFTFDLAANGQCVKSDVVYTRYADDITLSAKVGPRQPAGRSAEDAIEHLQKVLWAIFFSLRRRLESQFGLLVNPKKTHMMTAKNRQVVCGLVVNKLGDGRPEAPRCTRRFKRRLRAAEHQLRLGKAGPEFRGKKSLKNIMGRRAFVDMVERQGAAVADGFRAATT